MPRVFISIAIVSMLSYVAHAHGADSNAQIELPNTEDSQEPPAAEKNFNEEIFKRMFRERRKDHYQAVQILRKMDNYERVYKMIVRLGEKMVEVIESNKVILEAADFSDANGSFPQNTNRREAFSTILENTALFGDIVFHLPNITERILKTQPKWNQTMQWSINFAERANWFLDNATLAVINLAGQQLNPAKRDSEYARWMRTIRQTKTDKSIIKDKSFKKNRYKKGPRMIKMDL